MIIQSLGAVYVYYGTLMNENKIEILNTQVIIMILVQNFKYFNFVLFLNFTHLCRHSSTKLVAYTCIYPTAPEGGLYFTCMYNCFARSTV